MYITKHKILLKGISDHKISFEKLIIKGNKYIDPPFTFSK